MQASPTTFLAAALTAAVSMFTTAAATAQDTAWAWVSPANQGASFVPSPAWQYSSSGSTVVVDRHPSGNHGFVVRVPGMPSGGVVHATAHNGNHIAVVSNWGVSNGELRATIFLYTPTGAPANDANFSFAFECEGGFDARQAHLWANQPTTANYVPNLTYSWNANRADPSITRTGTGQYAVLLPGLANSPAVLGHVQVTPWGPSLSRANVAGWSAIGTDLVVTVRTHDANGVLADGYFILSYNETDVMIDPYEGSGTHLFANQATEPFYRANATYRYSNGRDGPAGEETIERLGVGRYRVSLPSVVGANSSNAQVTTYGFSNYYATLERWNGDGCGGAEVLVETFTFAGNPVDTRFLLRYTTNRPASKPVIAWASVDPRGQPTVFSPPSTHQYSSTGQSIEITKSTTPGVFWIRVPGAGRTPDGSFGVMHVTAHGSNHTAAVAAGGPNSGDITAQLRTWTAGGALTGDSPFTFYYCAYGDRREKSGYCWHSSPTAPVHTPLEAHSWNGDRGLPVISRSGTGVYQVRFPGLGTTGPEGGNAQVTPFTFSPMRAKVQSWYTSGSDVLVNVRCFDFAGNPIDGRFYCSYNEVASPMADELGSGAHVWANHATASSYTPHATYTDSNGTFGPDDAESIMRLATGHYRVHLPNVAPIDGAGVQVTAHGSTPTHASVESWTAAPSGQTGTMVDVRTWGPTGAPADSRFSLLYLTDEPAVEFATNESLGSGCNGVTIAALTRPILCRDWVLALDGVPATAGLAFLQLDLVGQSQLIGPAAPGCTIYTGGVATLFFPTPAPRPLFRQPIPMSPTFVGMDLFAQGGAFVPGVNAFSLAASNGLRGTIGEF